MKKECTKKTVAKMIKKSEVKAKKEDAKMMGNKVLKKMKSDKY